MVSDRGLTRAVVLGGFATGAALCFCLTLTGAVYFFVALFYIDDHRSSGADQYVASAFWGLSLTASCFVASRFGWRVGQDWYRNGR